MVTLENVSKSFAGQPVLRNVTLHIERGETMVIVGSSGTGKSVTLKHMVGLLRPDSGQVLIDGDEISSARGRRLERIREKFGVLFQSGALINWMTVAQNVALPLYEKTRLGDAEIAAKVKEKLALVNLNDCEDKRPAEISGGMKKRVALARAIIREPEILLYDEPTSGLDPVMSRHVEEQIISMQQSLGVTSIVVTHDLHSAFSIGDRIAMLHEGRVAEIGPPEAFAKSSESCVQEFIRAQFESGRAKLNPAKGEIIWQQSDTSASASV